MIEGQKILQISLVPTNLDGTQSHNMIEIEHKITKFRRYLPAGPLPGGGVRSEDLIQFYTERGGLRTVIARDLVI